MFTYGVALLKALGIDYESLSELMVLRGKRYKRGPSFSKQEHWKATEYCLRNNVQGFPCILIDGPTELTAWLLMQNSASTDMVQIGESQTASRDHSPAQQSPRQTSESKYQLTYRGVKYNVSKPNQ